MHRPIARYSLFALGATVLALSPGVAQDQPLNIEKLHAELEAAKVRFIKGKEAAQKQVLNTFDMLSKQVLDNRRITPAERIAGAKQLESDREAFLKNGYLTDNLVLVKVGWNYGLQLRKLYQPLYVKYEQTMSACLKAGASERGKAFLADREQFEGEHLPGRKSFTAGSRWKGTLYKGLDAILFDLNLSEVKDGQFKAELHQNVRAVGHPIFDISGPLVGIRVVVNVKNVTLKQGRARLTECEGLLLGDTLLLQLTTSVWKQVQVRPNKGPSFWMDSWLPTSGIAVLRRDVARGSAPATTKP